MNKTEYLNQLLNELTNNDHEENDDFYDDPIGYVEFRNNQGWYLIFHESRHFMDNGEYLGSDWKQAEKTLRLFYE